MNIVMGSDNAEQARDKYTVLELDTFLIEGTQDPVTAFCLVEKIPVDQLSSVTEFKDLHENLLKNYRRQNWKFCQDAIEHLVGRWGGELDTFYTDLQNRILHLKTQPLEENWNGWLVQR